MSAAGIVTRRGAALALAASLATRPALAHRALSALSTIDWNADAKRLEVVHTLHAQDIEAALAQLYPSEGAPDLTRARDQAKLALYVEQRFRISDDKGPIPLTAVGVDLQGQEAVFFQEGLRASPPAELTVENMILRDVFSQQANLVNIKMSAHARTLIFAGKDGAKTARGLV